MSRTLPRIPRPMPPPSVQEEGELFVPAREVHDYLRAAFIEPGAPFWRPEYEILETARIGVVWTNVRKVKAEMEWNGCMQLVTPNGDPWTAGLSMQHARESFMGWFDDLPGGEESDGTPDFRMFCYAPKAMEWNDAGFARFCAHELRHCSTRKNRWGEPQMGQDGRPVFAVRAHDVEVHLSEVEDFGVDACGPNVRKLIEVASKAPRFPGAYVTGVCGTCKLELVA